MSAPELPPALAAVIERIRADREHGASFLAQHAAEALERMTEQPSEDAGATLRGIQMAARTLATLRPSMAVLTNTVARIWYAGTRAATEDAPTRLEAMHAEAIHVRAAQPAASMLEHARLLLRGPLFTHSRSGTTEWILARLIEAGQVRRVLVTESRPGGEGVALARALGGVGAEVTLVADAACGHFVGEAGAVVVGADSVRADGGVVNKVGTYPLALAARAAGVPVYVLAEAAKIAPPTLPLVFEEMPPGELLPEPAPGVTARNIYFEHTPAELVTRLVTEDGPLDRAGIAARATRAAVALAALMETP